MANNRADGPTDGVASKGARRRARGRALRHRRRQDHTFLPAADSEVRRFGTMGGLVLAWRSGLGGRKGCADSAPPSAISNDIVKVHGWNSAQYAIGGLEIIFNLTCVSVLRAFGGSPLSIGSDIGGNLRTPWAARRTDNSSGPERRWIDAYTGFELNCSDVRSLARALESKPRLHEYDLVPIPWQMSTLPSWSGSNGRIRIGVMLMWDDGAVLPQPPVWRALKTVVDALKKVSTFEIVEYAPFKHFETSELTHKLDFVDGGAGVRERADSIPPQIHELFPTGLHCDPALDAKDPMARTYLDERGGHLVSRRVEYETVVRALYEISTVLPLTG
ncbi:hypothetical protein DFH09DRAFT_1106065 [Mycena vulgaris]|nr:hypothetical protein DFH09DRAFT_1112554 [Mycena vulgaris]KAJ6486602.1 hypothetical protein DFH09DRAFT_1106065 [Mycena vulgaris]